jgi:deoxycytidylate deaminase
MWYYFDLARKVALSRKDSRDFLIGSVGIRSDGVLVKACNGPVIIFDDTKKTSYPAAHAEYRLARKLDKGSVVFVCRVKRLDHSFGMARPCRDCQRTLASKGVKKVYYTINDVEFGVLYLDKRLRYSEESICSCL